ncbi:hypothetical protein FE394_09350 [Xenorhabdus sp. Reich]|uniref:DAPG hydrolase PhiG domain-containing protein n=1 Tax=Xenorhabdus littoralis TaxID=2582835 RepID=A0ABU4SL65_9GAMM|nr:hypothetical protein [Xenorhabdus sp. Reich]MDX7999402.1 hypothetical protein [Xenorhabdus sp. Reich]
MSRNLKERWDLDDIGNMLNPAPLRLEMGITRINDGRLVVACQSDLMDCKGAMLNWWFSYFCTTQHLKWWYPRDHKHHYGWDDKWKKGENYIGATIHAVESLNEIPPVAAKIKFHHPSDFFSSNSVASAFEKKWISAAVCGCSGFGDDEFASLSRILPSLYYAENTDNVVPPDWW